MAIEIKSGKLDLSSPSTTLVFDGAIQQFVVGLTSFGLSFPDYKGHNVSTIAASVSAKMADNELTVTVTGVLSDKGGNTVDAKWSWVSFGVVALTGSDPGTLTLAQSSAIESGGSAEISLLAANPVILSSHLSGFEMGYEAGTDNQVELASAGVEGASANGNQALVPATVEMQDNGGHTAATALADAGLIATFVEDAGLRVRPQNTLQTVELVEVDFGVPITAAAALISRFRVKYESNNAHDINAIRAGLLGRDGYGALPSVRDTVVVLPGPRSIMFDLGNPKEHTQSDTESWVDMVVVAVPARS
jgi:hypothetical protein